jgi:hypothetical protein
LDHAWEQLGTLQHDISFSTFYSPFFGSLLFHRFSVDYYYHTKMKFFTKTVVALCLAVADAALERSYTDDLGVTHTTTIEKPTIVTFAHSAVSFFDYGTNERNI